MTFESALQFLKEREPLRITVSGDIGSGKSTFAKRLSEELKIERIYIGGLQREEATRRKMTLEEYGNLLEQDDEIDRKMDELQNEKSKEIAKGVFEGRTAWHFNVAPDVKLFFSVDPKIGAERVYGDKNNKLRDKHGSVQEVVQANEARKKSEEKRYHNYYGISAYDLDNFDLVIDTSSQTINEVFQNTVIEMATHLKRLDESV